MDYQVYIHEKGNVRVLTSFLCDETEKDAARAQAKSLGQERQCDMVIFFRLIETTEDIIYNPDK